jgi:hypothetical protein
MTDESKDSEPYGTSATPPATPCECGATAIPTAMKPQRGTADWWDDPSPYWQCPACGQYRGAIYDVRYERDNPNPSPGTLEHPPSAPVHVERARSAEPSEAGTPSASPGGSTLRWRIGAGSPVVAEGGAVGWRLIVRGAVHVSSDDSDDLCEALRQLAITDPEVARDAFGVVVNYAGSWEDEYTEHHGEDALPFEYWLERISTEGLLTHVDEDGELYYAPK